MADLHQDLRDYFVSAGLVTAGNFFLDTWKDSPNNSAAVLEYAGGTSPVPGEVSERSLQVVVRDESAFAAKTRAFALYKSLVTADAVLELTPTRWCTITLRQTPFRLKVDEKGRVYYAFNVGVVTYID